MAANGSKALRRNRMSPRTPWKSCAGLPECSEAKRLTRRDERRKARAAIRRGDFEEAAFFQVAPRTEGWMTW